jgi:starch-binding outer membrane protein, SusD/RagB family
MPNNMTTKLIYRSVIAAVFAITLSISISSCKKYLDVEPVSLATPDYVFSNVENATKAILGTYAALTGDQAYGIRISMYYPYDNDEMMGQQGAPGDNERRDIAHYSAKPSNTQLAAPYAQLYSGIERANLCIYYIPKMEKYTDGTDAEIKELKRLHGEALTLRAQYYFELVRNWGDLPAQWQPSYFETDPNKAKTDRDSIYDRLLSDLAQAATMVPWRSEITNVDERLTQGSVRALRARIALYRGGWSLRSNGQMARGSNHIQYYQIAKEETNAVIMSNEHKLNSSFLSVFKDYLCGHKVEPNGEVVWEVAMSGGSSALGDSKLGYYNGPRYNNAGNSALTVLPTFFYSFDSLDTRRDVTSAPYNINANFTLAGRTLQTMTDGKFRRDWTSNPSMVNTSAQYMGINWPLIRFSDVLLMFAEADNEINNGPSAAAIDALRKVRLRAFGGNAALVGTIPTTKAGFFDAVVKERAWELASEGHRKYDLIRWNMLAQKIAETKTQLAAMAARQAPYNTLPATMYFRTGQTTMQWAGSFYKPTVTPAPAGHTGVAWVGNGITGTLITNNFAVGFTPNKSELLPIPESAIAANPNLTQNPKY